MEESFKPIDEGDLAFFANCIGASNVLTDDESLESHSRDYTEDLSFKPTVVLRPQTAEEISAIMAHCNEHRICVTPRAAGTGLSGGALSLYGGVCLSVDRMNRIIEIDEKNYQATVEPGVINQVFRDAVEEKGLFYPPDPASMGSCFLGGNVAENSGGPKAVKYGVTKDYVLNLEVVWPTGERCWTGANVLKNSTGYNLTQLVVGSEGTLGFVTKIVFRLIPKPKENLLLLAAFDRLEAPCEAVSTILNAGIIPSALEYMERNAVEWSKRFADISLSIPTKTAAILLIEVDGNDSGLLMKECEEITALLEEYNCLDLFFAESELEKERLWKVRRVCGEAVHSHSVYKEEDTVVPRYHLAELLKGVKDIGQQYGFESVCYGHAGDGNLHINILKGNLSENQWQETVKSGIREIFSLCKELGGTISGEHGIGLVQKEFMDVVMSPLHFRLMKGIKKVFDPKGILNPGKIFD